MTCVEKLRNLETTHYNIFNDKCVPNTLQQSLNNLNILCLLYRPIQKLIILDVANMIKSCLKQ